MRRKSSTLARAFRALTALITVWCIGCSGFEPLLSSALGNDGAGMSCASDGGAMTSGTAMQFESGATRSRSITTAGEHSQRFDCGCGSCHAVSPVLYNVATVIPRLPEAAHPALPSLVSAEPSALRPPPDRVA